MVSYGKKFVKVCKKLTIRTVIKIIIGRGISFFALFIVVKNTTKLRVFNKRERNIYIIITIRIGSVPPKKFLAFKRE